MNNINAAITCVHGVVPEKILTNKDLEKMVDTNDEWIVSRTCSKSILTKTNHFKIIFFC